MFSRKAEVKINTTRVSLPPPALRSVPLPANHKQVWRYPPALLSVPFSAIIKKFAAIRSLAQQTTDVNEKLVSNWDLKTNASTAYLYALSSKLQYDFSLQNR
jgi:hypothetical protein